MTVALLAKWGDQPPGTLFTAETAGTETAMIAAGQATATLAGAVAWVPPGNSPSMPPPSLGVLGGIAPAQYIRTRDGATDTSYAELAQFAFTKELGAALGKRGFIDIESVWAFSSVTQTKDINVLVGGVSIGTPSGASGNLSMVTKMRLYAEGAMNDQVGLNTGVSIYTASSNAALERTIDFTQQQVISFQAKWSADPGAAATIRLITYVVTVFPSPV